jgi:chromosome segregation ATPase
MNAISESVRILREAGVNEKQMLAHLEVIEQNMREHSVSPQVFNEFRIEVNDRFKKIDDRFNKVDEKFIKLDERFIKIDEKFNKIEEKFNLIEGKFNSIDARFNKLEKQMDRNLILTIGFLATLMTFYQYYKP